MTGILKLRGEKTNLLGYPTFADYPLLGMLHVPSDCIEGHRCSTSAGRSSVVC